MSRRFFFKRAHQTADFADETQAARCPCRGRVDPRRWQTARIPPPKAADFRLSSIRSPSPVDADRDRGFGQYIVWSIRRGGAYRLPRLSSPTDGKHWMTPTVVFDTYWRFAAERLAMFYRRYTDPIGPWTSDSILKAYRFTNAYRAADRVSQYLIREVQARPDRPQTAREIFFRTMLFKIFNRIDTWESLEDRLARSSGATLISRSSIGLLRICDCGDGRFIPPPTSCRRRRWVIEQAQQSYRSVAQDDGGPRS